MSACLFRAFPQALRELMPFEFHRYSTANVTIPRSYLCKRTCGVVTSAIPNVLLRLVQSHNCSKSLKDISLNSESKVEFDVRARERSPFSIINTPVHLLWAESNLVLSSCKFSSMLQEKSKQPFALLCKMILLQIGQSSCFTSLSHSLMQHWCQTCKQALSR